MAYHNYSEWLSLHPSATGRIQELESLCERFGFEQEPIGDDEVAHVTGIKKRELETFEFRFFKMLQLLNGVLREEISDTFPKLHLYWGLPKAQGYLLPYGKSSELHSLLKRECH